jgi:hypothetical protein
VVVVWLDTVLWIGGMRGAWWTMGGAAGAGGGGGGAACFTSTGCTFCNEISYINKKIQKKIPQTSSPLISSLDQDPSSSSSESVS